MTAEQLGLGEPVINSLGMVLVPIPAGEFQMGSPASEKGRESDETQHRVRITQPFYLGAHEVTRRQYDRVIALDNEIRSACYGCRRHSCICLER